MFVKFQPRAKFFLIFVLKNFFLWNYSPLIIYSIELQRMLMSHVMHFEWTDVDSWDKNVDLKKNHKSLRYQYFWRGTCDRATKGHNEEPRSIREKKTAPWEERRWRNNGKNIKRMRFISPASEPHETFYSFASPTNDLERRYASGVRSQRPFCFSGTLLVSTHSLSSSLLVCISLVTMISRCTIKEGSLLSWVCNAPLHEQALALFDLTLFYSVSFILYKALARNALVGPMTSV